MDGIATFTIVESTMISATAMLMKTRPSHRREEPWGMGARL